MIPKRIHSLCSGKDKLLPFSEYSSYLMKNLVICLRIIFKVWVPVKLNGEANI